MALSTEQRAQLLARAQGLREDVSSIRAETEQAFLEQSQVINDDKLVLEVERLEAAKSEAMAVRDRATGGTAEEAIAVMNQAAGFSVKTDAEVAVLEKSADKTEAPIVESMAVVSLDDPFVSKGGVSN